MVMTTTSTTSSRVAIASASERGVAATSAPLPLLVLTSMATARLLPCDSRLIVTGSVDAPVGTERRAAASAAETFSGSGAPGMLALRGAAPSAVTR